MLAFKLKNGEVVHVALKNLDEFLRKNKGNLATHLIELRGELDFEGVMSNFIDDLNREKSAI